MNILLTIVAILLIILIVAVLITRYNLRRDWAIRQIEIYEDYLYGLETSHSMCEHNRIKQNQLQKKIDETKFKIKEMQRLKNSWF